MKCPKCRYLSFEPELRCKHCGYDFSLAEPSLAVQTFDELEQQNPDPPLVDLQLRSVPAPAPAPSPASVPRRAAVSIALADREDTPPAPRPTAMPRPVRQLAGPTPDLPLFIRPKEMPAAALALDRGETPADGMDELAVRVPAAPRPLVVRRRAPDSGRQASAAVTAAAPALVVNRADRDLLDYLRRVETEAVPAAFPSETAAAHRREAVAADDAVSLGTRFKALGIDVLLLAALNGGVVLLTLRQCDLGVNQWAGVPLLPLSTFLMSLSASYLLMFNVFGGQTVGKMLCGLRVVGDPMGEQTDAAATARQLSYRALLSIPSVLLLGLGFLPLLAGNDRSFHDRLTRTRIVRA